MDSPAKRRAPVMSLSPQWLDELRARITLSLFRCNDEEILGALAAALPGRLGGASQGTPVTGGSTPRSGVDSWCAHPKLENTV